jgi:hypothetical protein
MKNKKNYSLKYYFIKNIAKKEIEYTDKRVITIKSQMYI